MSRPRIASTEARGFALRVMGLSVILAAALTRMGVGFEPFPGWDADPFVLEIPGTALGPAGSIALDLVSILGAAIAMFGAALAGARACTPLWTAIALGAALVAYHARLGQDVFVDHLRLGSQWAAALIGAAAAFEVCRDERLRRIAAAALVAGVVMLACKGALQLLVEHPQTLDLYKQNRQEFFASQGWAADSAAGRAFDRRLLQPEATGWFGMANVFASWGAFGGAAMIAALAFLAPRRSTPQKPIPWVTATLTLGALTGIACVAMADSKGGWAALAFGCTIAAALAIATRRTRDGAPIGFVLRHLPLVPISGVALALLAVVARGLIGEHLSENSLLFRWFYMIGASRAVAAHPLTGVGPDGFKDAYMLLKPPLSPEEVTSPHSLLFDFAATLGAGGIAWGIVWLWWVWRVGSWFTVDPRAHATESSTAGWTPRHEVRLLFVILSAPTVIGAMTEISAGTPEGTIARIVGLIAATAVGAGILATLRTNPRAAAALACGAAAMAAHAQIELTPVWPGSAPAFFLVFGALAAGRTGEPGVKITTAAARGSLLVSGAILLWGASLLTLGWRPVARWESELRAALTASEPASESRSLIQQLEHATPSDRAAAAGRLSDHLSRVLGRPVGDTESAMRRGLEDVFLHSGEQALAHLNSAAVRVTHPGTLRAISRLALQLSATHRDRGEQFPSALLVERAEDSARQAAELPLQHASSLGWLGTVRMSLATSTDNRAERELAVSAWEGAAAADPYGLTWHVKLARALADLGRAEEAAGWARRALENDENSRLDTLRGLTAAEKVEMSGIARGS